MRVTLFPTCLGERFFAEAAADAVRLLRHLGVEVEVPAGATCCGQPAFNSGHRDEAVRMVRHTLSVLNGADHVVLPSGSCAAMLRHHAPDLVAEDDHELAVSVAERTWELSQFIVQVLGNPHIGNGLRGWRVAYHHGCHALRDLGVREEPLTLLRAAGATVVAWTADQECCGFGGLFSVKLPEVATAMADRKLDTLPAVDLVTSADGGCLMQLGGRAARRGGAPEFRHLASVLWEAAAGASGPADAGGGTDV